MRERKKQRAGLLIHGEKRVKVVQEPEDEVPKEVLAKAIVEVADAAQKLIRGPLTRRAVVVLIHDACKNKVGKPAIEMVLDAAADLKRLYVR